MKLKEALGLSDKEVICLVGGGGKTTIMFALAHELAMQTRGIVTTTTTRIMVPTATETEKLLVADGGDALLEQVAAELHRYRHVTAARGIDTGDKLYGISPETAMALARLQEVSHLIIEADGAARRPLKAPRDHEPIIPPNTTLVIVVVGIDAFGSPLDEEHVFRSTIASDLLGVPPGTIVDAEIMSRLVTLPAGIAKGSPPSARIIPFINKIDVHNGLEKGRLVGRSILARKHPRIDRVLLGRAQHSDPVVEVVRNEP